MREAICHRVKIVKKNDLRDLKIKSYESIQWTDQLADIKSK